MLLSLQVKLVGWHVCDMAVLEIHCHQQHKIYGTLCLRGQLSKQL